MKRNRCLSRGFTLIEISVVIILMALLASAVAMSAGGMVNGATREETIAQIESLDSEARRTAKRLGHAIELHIDCDLNQLTLRDPRQPSNPMLGGLTTPRQLDLAQAWRLVHGEPQENTSLVIRYEPDGTAKTWGLTISDSNTDEAITSVVILGMTGQMTQFENHEQSSTILAKALGRHTD